MAEEVVATPFGKFLVDPAECIGSTVKAGTVWDGPGFLQVIAREHGCLGEVGTTILDVGAHLGDWTIWLAGQGAWRVVAVEPAPHMLRVLTANLDLNKPICADRVIVLPIAAYARREVLRWRLPYNPVDSGGADLIPASGDVEAVIQADIQAEALDSYQYLFGQRVSLVKIDAQGCDGMAILGLTRTLRRDHPVVVFEWEAELARPHRFSLQDTIETLGQFGYTVHEWPSHRHNYLALPRKEA